MTQPTRPGVTGDPGSSTIYRTGATLGWKHQRHRLGSRQVLGPPPSNRRSGFSRRSASRAADRAVACALQVWPVCPENSLDFGPAREPELFQTRPSSAGLRPFFTTKILDFS
uniref:uncharacterized protein LOC128928836 n=1 Tax=Callithrix jacchus TaxID=9483 RepID=UPI0023DD3328|nr:uncharacterized protein LOC128928836 [Callithrix jacchus]